MVYNNPVAQSPIYPKESGLFFIAHLISRDPKNDLARFSPTNISISKETPPVSLPFRKFSAPGRGTWAFHCSTSPASTRRMIEICRFANEMPCFNGQSEESVLFS